MTRSTGVLLLLALLVTAPLVLGANEATIEVVSGGSCQSCHLELDEPELREPAVGFAGDVHDRPGLGCTACHGGDAQADDPEEAMDPRRGFRGRPRTLEIPGLCGSCHADEAFVKRFAPNLVTDQLSQYRTSVHGQRIAAGDEKAATCVSCHGVHGILEVSDPRSPVYPTHVVDTCAGCHADPSLMTRYSIPTTQAADYRRSVHFRVLTERNDLSAPTCNDCHGSHGATPPGVSSISNVCGTCHPQNMELFQGSPHAAPFAELELGACEACHLHHLVESPDDAMLGVDDGAVCAECHATDDRGGEVAAALRTALRLATETWDRARAEVGDAERKGMLMDDAEVALEQAHEEVIKARLNVHALAISAVTENADAATDLGSKALELAAAARREILIRRRGLEVALVLMALAIVGLVLKIRQLGS